MTEPRLPQLNVEVTPQTKAKLARLESQLVRKAATKPEIVAVLLRRATAAAISAAELEKYRAEVERERRKLRAAANSH